LRSALEGERKQVTVLFADVRGSMDLAEQVDPEEWHKIMDRFFAILSDGIHSFEGTINQYTGDGIMALFGAPIAHEDHARRACYAALHLQQELRRYADELRLKYGLGFSVRMGINSGEVVVGKIGDDLRMDYTAQGHTVGLAARMEQMADTGKVLLSGQTGNLVSGYFELRDLGEAQVKGLSDQLHVFELEGIGRMRTRLDVSRARGFTKFVGRQSEMAVLEGALAQAIAGNAQLVGVVAEPGTGKSRLCYEFAERCRAQGIPVYEARGVAHGKAVPLLPVLEFFRNYFGITEQDTPRAARDKIAGRMLLLDEKLSEALPLMFDFLGVPDPARPSPPIGPEARQRRFLDLSRQLARARSAQEPAVLLLEDLHCFDKASDEYIENVVVEVASGNRTLLLLNFRPEYQASWMRKSYYHQLPLQALGAEAIRELFADLIGTDPSLDRLTELIRERTGGNPFFIEESVHSLVEAGALVGTRGARRLGRPAHEIAVPASVQSVLAARIDRLPEREKQVLQVASVIGQRFSEPILHRVAEVGDGELPAALHALLNAEFLYEEALYPEAEYAFKHPLTREVAYRSQLADRRSCAHAAIARAMEEVELGKLDERAALLAYHWEQAGGAREAAKWHQRAAEWVGLNNPAEALRHWASVRQRLDTLPETPENLAEGAEVRAAIMSHLAAKDEKSWLLG
jgi:class 3 adenylate cyclase